MQMPIDFLAGEDCIKEIETIFACCAALRKAPTAAETPSFYFPCFPSPRLLVPSLSRPPPARFVPRLRRGRRPTIDSKTSSKRGFFIRTLSGRQNAAADGIFPVLLP
ncbi:hypothetical protein L596_023695 [Steinernema carpocapsae]|uniref:Uncharacterized protein n=1 Tax=Steinernema carpocapsae TaxID=34508 RepID=A0A4U5MEG6_STECR|nr:hypothetical protein L596_023695 [Steinernema carpocapsae]